MNIKILVSVTNRKENDKEYILIDQTICGLSKGDGVETPDIYLKREILGAIRAITKRCDYMGIKYNENQKLMGEQS